MDYELTLAQEFYLDLGQMALDGKGRDYKAPHAYRGTSEKARYARKTRFAAAWNDEGDVIAVRHPRLFRGHRH